MSEPVDIEGLRKFTQSKAVPDHCTRCQAWCALPDLLTELEAARVELVTLHEWKEQAAPTLAAALATLQRVGEGAEKMRERAKPPEGVEWSHQTDAYRDCADILKEALGDET